MSLSRLLAEITGIDEKYLLTLEGIHGASIAQRMSWASNRTTTRSEDIAYCLLGLFSLNLNLIYGEGSKAFIRLQEEIIKVSDDHSIFAWTWLPELADPLIRGRRTGGFPSRNAANGSLRTAPHTKAGFPLTRLQALRDNSLWTNPERPTMMAPDPLVFHEAGSVEFLAPSDDVAPFALTNAGLSISLPLISQGDKLHFAVIHSHQDRKRQEQVLVCIPLAKHGRQTHRYTRTCFPRRPITIRRQGLLNFDDITKLVRPIQVCRDVQQVPFYYNSFGGTNHPYGFWFFVPGGWKDFAVVRGFATPNGVYNDYGIFFSRPTTQPDQFSKTDLMLPAVQEPTAQLEKTNQVDQASQAGRPSQISGGLVVLQNSAKKTVVVFLGRTMLPEESGVSAEQMHVKVLVQDRSQIIVDGRSRDRSQILLGGKVSDALPEDLEQLFRDLCREIDPSVETASARAHTCEVFLRNSAPLSLSPNSDVVLTEIVFGDTMFPRSWTVP